MDITFSPSLPSNGYLVVPVLKDRLEEDVLRTIDRQTDGAVVKAARLANFRGKPGETLTVAGPGGMENVVVLLLGLGDAGDLSPIDALGVGGKAFAAINGRTTAGSLVLGDLNVAGVSGALLAVAAAEGAKLRAYDFAPYRKKTAPKDRTVLEDFTIVSETAADAEDALRDRLAVADGVDFARDLVSEPPNILYPASYADRCRELESLGVEIVELDDAKMEELGMGSLLGVGQGSVHESRIVAMVWNGGPEGEPPVALVGKGVTFDTGGISLKPPGGMEDMKFDMGGSAAVAGAMKALAGRKAKANVVGLVGLVENMPDGNAQRPSDVVTSMSGQTIEVLNTDAEGRLVLADVMTYTQETYKPKAIIDLATLTGAIIVSLAHEYGGLFSRQDDFANQLLSSATASGEKLWRMPLDKTHDEMLKSDIADMKNVGPREAGSSTAAAFIGKFVEKDIPWAHLDIAGMAWAKKDGDICPKGATGYGVRLLDRIISDHYETV